MNSRRQATLSDIAQDVGVSTATVSRVLANAPGHRAGKDTRRAILEVAERLDYQPNVAARALSTGQAPLIGIVMPSLAAEQFPAIIAGVEEEAVASGYQTVVISGGRPNKSSQVAAIQAIQTHHVSGVIVCPMDAEEDEALRTEAEGLPPMVLVERPIPHPSAPTVAADNRNGGWKCGQWLGTQGCDRALFVHSSQQNFPSIWTQRSAGMTEALTATACEHRNLFLDDASSLSEYFRWLFQAERPGMCLASFFSLRRLLRQVSACDLDLPTSLRLCGFDRAVFSLDDVAAMTALGHLDQPPHYVHYSGQEIGHQAARLLLQRLENGAWSQQTIVVPVS